MPETFFIFALAALGLEEVLRQQLFGAEDAAELIGPAAPRSSLRRQSVLAEALFVDKVEAKKKRSDSHPLIYWFEELFASLGFLSTMFLYPMILVPLYRSDVFTDGMRLVFICAVHPIIQEFAAMQRRNGERLDWCYELEEDRERDHFALSYMLRPGREELGFIFFRRFMIGLIVDPGM